MMIKKSDKRTRIRNLRKGALFVTDDGITAVKSEYHLSNGNCQCILLASGEYAYFPEGDETLVYEVWL